MSLIRWLAAAVLTLATSDAGTSPPDVLILRGGTRVEGVLVSCDAKYCKLDGKIYPRGAIEWIGLASGAAVPPKIQHPETDEEHMRDGSVRAARLLSIDTSTVAVADGSFARPRVAFVHLARPSPVSTPPQSQVGPPSQKSPPRILHFSVRIEAHAAHYHEGNKGLPLHVLSDTTVDWTAHWPSVAVQVDDATGRIDIFHAEGTPYPEAGEFALAETKASLAYHMIVPAVRVGRPPVSVDCKDSVVDKVYPVRLRIAGSAKAGAAFFSVVARTDYPAGAYDPELLQRKSQNPVQECQVTDPGWPPMRTFAIPDGLEFVIQPDALVLAVRRNNSQDLFFPLDAILGGRSFIVETGPQREEITPRDGSSDVTKNVWQAKIEFTGLDVQPGPDSSYDCVGSLAALASSRDQNCSALQAAQARCAREVRQCNEQTFGLRRACDNATAEYEQRRAACASKR